MNQIRVIANSLFYYHVPEPIEPYWIAQCSLPAIPLDNQALTEGFQEFELRCISPRLFPNMGYIPTKERQRGGMLFMIKLLNLPG